jgi:hypothetical protein
LCGRAACAGAVASVKASSAATGAWCDRFRTLAHQGRSRLDADAEFAGGADKSEFGGDAPDDIFGG